MKKLSICLCTLIIVFAALSFTKKNAVPIEKGIKDFSLKSTNNKLVTLSSYKKAKGFILVFTCNKCPMAKLYSKRLNAMYAKYKKQGVYLMAINSMDTVAYKEESFALMQKKVTKEQLHFPYLQDKLQVVAKQFKATYTPQSFVVWKNQFGSLSIKYEGAIDDSALEPSKANNYLEKAVDQLLQNKAVSLPTTKSVGCRIYFRGEINKMNL